MTDRDVLGVSSNATKEECKRAYRFLCKKYHPDADGGDADKFIRVKEAWERISSEDNSVVVKVSSFALTHAGLFSFRVISVK